MRIYKWTTVVQTRRFSKPRIQYMNVKSDKPYATNGNRVKFFPLKEQPYFIGYGGLLHFWK